MELKTAEAEFDRIKKELGEVEERLKPHRELAMKRIEGYQKARDEAIEGMKTFNNFLANNEIVGRAVPREQADAHRERILKRVQNAIDSITRIDRETYEAHKDDFDRSRVLNLELMGCQEVIEMLKTDSAEAKVDG